MPATIKATQLPTSLSTMTNRAKSSQCWTEDSVKPDSNRRTITVTYTNAEVKEAQLAASTPIINEPSKADQDESESDSVNTLNISDTESIGSDTDDEGTPAVMRAKQCLDAYFNAATLPQRLANIHSENM